MAAVTLLGSATFNTTAGNKSVVATPAVGDLIVIVCANTGRTTAQAPTITDNNSSGTYTQVASATKASSADACWIYVRTAKIAAASSTTFSMAQASDTGGGLAVLKVTGMAKVGASAARQSAKQDNQASGTPTPVFSAAALTGNPVIGAQFNATNSTASVTPRSSPAYTERFENGYNSPATGLEIMSIDGGETATSIAWGNAAPSAFCAIVLELDASVGATSTASFSASGSASGRVQIAATSTASASLSATSTASVSGGPLNATSTASFGATGSSAGQVAISGTATGSFAVAGSAAGQVQIAGVSTAATAISGSAAATVELRGTSAASVATSGSAAGAVAVQGSSTASIDVTGSSTGAVSGGPVAATSEAAFAVAGNAAGEILISGASAASFELKVIQETAAAPESSGWSIAPAPLRRLLPTIRAGSMAAFHIAGRSTGTVRRGRRQRDADCLLLSRLTR